MKILGWNCRGPNSSAAIRAISDLQEQVRADVAFLSESHLVDANADSLRRKLGFDSMLVEASNGRAGGLVLFWKNQINVTMQYLTLNFMDAVLIPQ